MHIIEPVDYYGSEDQAINNLHISNMEKRINAVISKGVPPSKVVMDVYFSVFQFPRFSSVPVYTELPYNQFCSFTSNNETSIVDRQYLNGASLVTFQYKNQSNVVHGSVFQNTRSMANRAQLAMKSGLGGLSAIFINYDDFRGNCGIHEDTFDDFKSTAKFSKDILKRSFPLLRTINEAIIAALDEKRQEEKPNKPSECRPWAFICKFLPFC